MSGQLITVATFATNPGSIEVRGLLYAPRAGAITAPDRIAPVRALEPGEVAKLFVRLLDAGMVEIPQPMPDGTVVWRPIGRMVFRLRAQDPPAPTNNQPRIIVPGEH